MSSKSKKLTSKDVLLLLLYSSGMTDEINEYIKGRTRIVKMIFIFQKEIYKKFKFDMEEIKFKAWDFGPWSGKIYEDIEFFKNIGFIKSEIETTENDLTIEEANEYEKWKEDSSLTREDASEYQQEIFKLGKLGVDYIKDRKLYEELSENQKKILKEFKKKFVQVSLFTILQYVYRNYPDMAKKSKIKNDLL